MAKSIHLPRQLRLILAITAVYAIAWFAFLSQVPLGLYPTAEEASRLATAMSLAAGNTPEGLSVTLYEYILSHLDNFADSESRLILLARALNVLALMLATALCAHAAGLYWKKYRSVWISGFLTGLNPVLVFWSTEVAPTMLAVLCAIFAYSRLLLWLRRPTLRRSLLIGSLITLGGAFECTLLPFAVVWPLFAWIYPKHNRLQHLGTALLFPAIAFAFLLVSNFQLHDPFGGHISNIGQGIYEVVNSHEPFEGKSYNLHNRITPFLLFNPLHWGIIFIMALAACYTRMKDGHKGNSIITLLITLSIFSVSYALNDAGSQARSALIPIFAVYAGGAVAVPRIWTHAGKRTRRRMLAGLIALVAVTYSDFYGQRSESNWEQDYALLAEANLDLQRNTSAAEWANKALDLNPERRDMQTILDIAAFNQWALVPNPMPLSVEAVNIYLEEMGPVREDDSYSQSVRAIYQFKLQQKQQAVELWERHRERSALALICLYWCNETAKPRPDRIDLYKGDPHEDLLRSTLEINRKSVRYGEGKRILDNILSAAH